MCALIYGKRLIFRLLPLLLRTFSIFSTVLLVTRGDDCVELLKRFRHPCDCFEDSSNGPQISLVLNCDRVVFPNDLSALPNSTALKWYSQKHVGYQALPVQLFSTTGLSIHGVDFSYNSLRRMTEKVFVGLQTSLRELLLADNLLGDTLNPIFSSNEFRGLSQLRLIDLSGNQIRALEQGILEGCHELKVLKLDRNRLIAVPSLSLNGPYSLQVLSLSHNRIGSVEENAFISQISIERIDLSANSITSIASHAFYELAKLKYVNLSFNKLSHMNSDVFEGAVKLSSLDLSRNFFNEFPEVALKHLKELRFLNLSSNMLQKIDGAHIAAVPYLEVLDLSRNSIASVAANGFSTAQYLRHLDLSVNMLRAVEEGIFHGLNNLETVVLEDNNILAIPSNSLNHLPKLKVLKLGYNRITAVSAEILSALANRVTDLGLNYNVIREIPSHTFQHFKKLKSLDLDGNLLTSIEPYTFTNSEKTLTSLNLRGNKLSSLVLEETSILQNLLILDASSNHLKDISPSSFVLTPSLFHLNLSRNYHQLNMLPATLLHPLTQLTVLDVSRNSIRTPPTDLFARSASLKWVSLSDNGIVDLSEDFFEKLTNLTYLDISFNSLSNIKSGTFASLYSLRTLDLRGNRLSTFKGEFFITWRSNGTALEELDLSDNQVSYLFPSSFKVHPRLKKISIARNKFNFFPGELIAGLNNLREIDLTGNALKTVDEFDFGRLPRLRILRLNDNQIETISETAFHNSTQLQWLDLSDNALEKLDERLFQGFYRIEWLNLRQNFITELPDTIFERQKVRMLENINLAANKFVVAPLKSLQKQYFFLNSVDLSYNRIRDIPTDDSTMVNIKRLDLSFNPLTQAAVVNVLGEPKTVRDLNLAGTKIAHLPRLETPFLQRLNLSRNSIEDVGGDKTFERTTLLESLDLSDNAIADITKSLLPVWSRLRNLRQLDLSSNPIESIVQKDLDGVDALRKLRIANLDDCSKIEKAAFKNMANLVELDVYGFPKLGYLDVVGLLRNLPSLEALNIELKDPVVNSEQLSAAMNPRLHTIGIWGKRITAISSGALAGIRTADIAVYISNTSLTTIPSSLLIPLPRSSAVSLYLGENQLKTLSAQVLSSLDDRRHRLTIRGLEKNPLHCDCNARALRRSPLSIAMKCVTPDYLADRYLTEVADDELICGDAATHRLSSTPFTSTMSSQSSPITIIKVNRQTQQRFTTEPDIIWSLPSSSSHPTKNMVTIKPPTAGMTVVSNDDTLIIGIVGGVVAFIALLVIVICIIRLRMSSSLNTSNNVSPYNNNNGSLTTLSPTMVRSHCNNPSCPCPKIASPPPPTIYAYNSGGSYSAATLPSKMVTPSSLSSALRASYATIGRPYNQGGYCNPYALDEKEFAMR